VSDVATLRQLVERHARYTGSARARHVLAHWDDSLRHFVRVIPTEYLAALTATSAPAADQRVGDVGSARA
jgi:glutamate synthase domain-containing protein 3